MAIRIKQLIIVGLLCLSIWTIDAQEDSTPIPPSATPEGPSFIYTWSAEVFYPAIIRFNVIVDRPLETITTAALSIQPEGQDTLLLEFDPQEIAIFADEFTELSYILELTPETVFPFDSLVEYTWLMTTSQDGAGAFSGAFVFTDNRSTWTNHIDPESQVNLYLPDDMPGLTTDNLWYTTHSVYGLLAQHTSQSPTFDLALFTTDTFPLNPCETNEAQIPTIVEPQSEQEFNCQTAVIEASFNSIGMTTLEVSTSRSTQVYLSDYLFRQFYSNLWQNITIPDWFKEGLRQFYIPTLKSDSITTLRSAGRNNQLFTLAELEDFNIEQENRQTTLQAQQSYGMVLYIANQIGFDGLVELAQQLNALSLDIPFTSVYETQVGQPLNGLLLNFNNWLYTNVAESDFNVLPYQESTSLPTITATLTPFPPTPSFTPTATATYTPTPTVTGFLTATPLPSLTPTATRRPQEPTNTPRSALNLQESQLADTTNSDGAQSGDDTFSILGILLISGGIIALSIVLALTFRNNQGNRS